MSRAERDLLMFRMRRLGAEWDRRLQQEWLSGRPAAWLAHHYGLELETIEALIPDRIRRK